MLLGKTPPAAPPLALPSMPPDSASSVDALRALQGPEAEVRPLDLIWHMTPLFSNMVGVTL